MNSDTPFADCSFPQSIQAPQRSNTTPVNGGNSPRLFKSPKVHEWKYFVDDFIRAILKFNSYRCHPTLTKRHLAGILPTGLK